MVHRRTAAVSATIRLHDDDAAAGEQLVVSDERKVKVRGRRDAIMAIKAQMLRCNRGGEQSRRFKRSYLGYCGGDRAGRGDDAAILYLACLVACSPPRVSTS